jgi:hypothetical protein
MCEGQPILLLQEFTANKKKAMQLPVGRCIAFFSLSVFQKQKALKKRWVCQLSQDQKY